MGSRRCVEGSVFIHQGSALWVSYISIGTKSRPERRGRQHHPLNQPPPDQQVPLHKKTEVAGSETERMVGRNHLFINQQSKSRAACKETTLPTHCGHFNGIRSWIRWASGSGAAEATPDPVMLEGVPIFCRYRPFPSPKRAMVPGCASYGRSPCSGWHGKHRRTAAR